MCYVVATVTETSPIVLKLTADWPVDGWRETGIRIMEIQRELLPGEILDLPSVTIKRAAIDGNRATGRNCKSAIWFSLGASFWTKDSDTLGDD